MKHPFPPSTSWEVSIISLWMVDLCQPLLAFNGLAWETIGRKVKWRQFPQWLYCLLSLDHQPTSKQAPICLSSAGSRPVFQWTVAVAHPHLMTFVISVLLLTTFSSSSAWEEAKSRLQSLPFTLGYWHSVHSDCGRGQLCCNSVFLGWLFLPTLLSNLVLGGQAGTFI